MSGQCIVTIDGKQFTCIVANTFLELTQGLSNVESLSQGTGMLFDLGSDQSYISIDMSRMRFPLDIIFINSTYGVVGVLRNIQPNENAVFNNTSLPGARLFLEVNAGEAEGINVGDTVNISGYVISQQSDIFQNIIYMSILMFGMLMIMKMIDKPKKLTTYDARKAELDARKAELENIGKNIAMQAGVEFIGLNEDWRYAPRYWFRDSKGNKIIATDIEELRWKLSSISSTQAQNVLINEPSSIWNSRLLAINDVLTDTSGYQDNFMNVARTLMHIEPELFPTAYTVIQTVKRFPKYFGITKDGILYVKPEQIPQVKSCKCDLLPDSPEFLAYTIDDIGYRDKIDKSFRDAISRAKK